MPSILANAAIKEAIQQIAVRTEREDPDNIIDSFYDCNIISHLTNKNHQIIQGRRGTGKTHILLVLKNKLESIDCHGIYFDCKATGSAADISDTTLPEKHRVIQLMRDFLLYIYKDLLSYFDDILRYNVDETITELSILLDELHDECYIKGERPEKYLRNHNKKAKSADNTLQSASISFSSMLSAIFDSSEQKQREQESLSEHNMSGVPYEKVVFPNVYQCLNRIAEITNKKFVIYIDEWSNLPLDVQPHFAEFLRRCFISSNYMTVKIAVVKDRTRYCIKNGNIVYGFEIGADISVAMDLDNVYMYDKNPRKVFSDLYRILWTHLKAKGVINNLDINSFLQTFFYDLRSAILLVRASEGNPRDFISIIDCCIVEMDGIGCSQTWVDSQVVHNAANSWYHMDKESALSVKQKRFLSELSAYVVRQKKSRGFVIAESYLSHSAFQGLIDARILHVAQTGKYFINLGNYPMAIVVLDFGTYSDILINNQDIHFLTNDPFERIVFSEHSPSKYDDIYYNFDENRKFKFCFFDPELSSICPSFHLFN